MSKKEPLSGVQDRKSGKEKSTRPLWAKREEKSMKKSLIYTKAMAAVIRAHGEISMCEVIEIVEQLVLDKQMAEYEERGKDES